MRVLFVRLHRLQLAGKRHGFSHSRRSTAQFALPLFVPLLAATPASWKLVIREKIRWLFDIRRGCETLEEMEDEDTPTLEEVLVTEQAIVKVYSRIVIRIVALSFYFFPAFVTLPLVYFGKSWEDKWWTIFLWCIERAGPVFMKFGQWVAARCDLFPKACFRFVQLQDNTKQHPWVETEKLLTEVFGEHWKKIFLDFEKEPIGSGCVAQVYRARVKNSFMPVRFRKDCRSGRSEIIRHDMPDYTDVAIKVLHPNVRYYFIMDIIILKLGVEVLRLIYPWSADLKMTASLNTFEELMAKQTDLRVEAANVERFILNFRNDHDIHFPTPIRPWVRAKVMVETFEPGFTIDDYRKAASTAEKKQIVEIAYDMLLKMILEHNFVHTDLHAGNILFRREPFYERVGVKRIVKLANIEELEAFVQLTETPKQIQHHQELVVLDCGIVSQLRESKMDNFKHLFRALIENEGKKVAELFLDGVVFNEKHREAYNNGMINLVDEMWHYINESDNVEIGKMMTSLFELLQNFDMQMTNEFASIMMSFLLTEGWGKSLHTAPDFMRRAKPFLLRQQLESGSETFHRIIHKYNRYYEIVGGLDLLNIFEQQNQ